MGPVILRIFKEKCPFCGKADVFEKKAFPNVPEVHASCSSCKRDLQGEPGFYFGAMYVSYGIAVGIGLLTFFIVYFLFGVRSTFWQITWVIVVVLLLAMKNYKWSRLIWLAMFPPKKIKS